LTKKTSQSTIIVIPVKELDKAKSRLESVLSPKERKKLILSMLQDVTTCIQKKMNDLHLFILSNDPIIKAYADENNYGFIKDTKNDLNKSINDATQWALVQGYKKMLIIPSDLPLITEIDLKKLLAPRTGPLVILSPSKDRGTNALFRNPPNIIQSSFGDNSFEKHIRLAEKVKCRYEVVKSSTLELDIDTLNDLEEFIHIGNSKTTSSYIIESGIDKKLRLNKSKITSPSM
jgi:2-phospho-L-lactate guanylyltransferase